MDPRAEESDLFKQTIDDLLGRQVARIDEKITHALKTELLAVVIESFDQAIGWNKEQVAWVHLKISGVLWPPFDFDDTQRHRLGLECLQLSARPNNVANMTSEPYRERNRVIIVEDILIGIINPYRNIQRHNA